MRLGDVAEDVGEVGVVCQEVEDLVRRELGPQAALDCVGPALQGARWTWSISRCGISRCGTWEARPVHWRGEGGLGAGVVNMNR